MKALITGITGQDGSYLSRFLLEKGYEVHGIIRRSSSFNTGRIDDIFNKLHLHYGDMTDATALSKIINDVKPDEIYNLAAQSHVKVSFELPEYTANADAIGSLRLFEVVKNLGLTETRIYQASTSEMFGSAPAPQDENTPFQPCSPYGTAKLYAYWIAKNYREAYDMHISNGIMFNHESPARGDTFVTRKITKEVAKYHKTGSCNLVLGNIHAVRDWGHAKDYVRAMWMMLQQPFPGDYVIATNTAHSVKEFVEAAFNVIGVSVAWNTINGVETSACDTLTKKILVTIDEKYTRPNEVWFLQGDYSLASNVLKWAPEIGFNELVKEMVNSDINR